MSISKFTTTDKLEYKGVLFEHNDRVYIKGQHGKFFFRSYEKNDVTGADWVNVFEDNHCLRSFHLDKIIVSKSKRGARFAVVCTEHPKYLAKRRPRTDCARCWAGYEAGKKS
jgi:hypothetical protein